VEERRRPVWVRAWRRIAAHRGEAVTVGLFMISVAIGTALTGVSSRVLALIATGGVASGVACAFATVWAPIAVIDFRRCTRETALRARVEQDLERHTRQSRAEDGERNRLLLRTEDVLASGGPAIVYQPIVALEDRLVVGYEALSRFGDRTTPDRWFADAASVGLGVELELAAVANALRSMERLPGESYLSVNASPDTLRDPRLLSLVAASDANRIVLELTEQLGFDDYDAYRMIIGQVHEIGARVAVDDTGSGYAGFRHIVDLRPDIIKVDRALVRGIDADPARRSLMIALVAFAQDVGATLIAEGVEEPEQDRALRQWGVRFGQGWLYGKPEPLAGRRPATMTTAH
jgi:EAL domain-containing protein (putative c-di-GMP-specific phosphodiesterase class I)